MKDNIRLRPACETEAHELSELASRSKAHWPYEKSYLDLCRSVTRVTKEDIRHWHFTVAEDGGQICGFAAVCPVNGDNMLDHLWIEPEYIGKGIGRALFNQAIANARSMGWRKFMIASDPYAEEFYLRMGARRIGERESKVKPGFFLPLLEYNLGLTLIGDDRIKQIPIKECDEPLVDLIALFPHLVFDQDRLHVQKDSKRISLARRIIGERLSLAQSLLPKGVRLLLKECYRPMSVQRSFWDGYSRFLREKYPAWSEKEIYDECSKLNAPLDVAPHTTGGAVDLTLMSEVGMVLDMGTEFNASPLSTQQATYTDANNISSDARSNRQILFSVMSKAGFVNYPTEWWHWSYGDKYWAFVAGKTEAIFASIENEPNL